MAKGLDRDYITKGKYFLGEQDGGKCYLTWELYNGKKGVCFSMQGERWESKKEKRRGHDLDITDGGQCCDRIAAWFPKDTKAARMVEIWKRWHLNDCRAGDAEQEAFIREFKASGKECDNGRFGYDALYQLLKDNGLNPHNGYSYGHEWKFEEIPADIIAEIMAWKNPADMTANELTKELT